jgi:hypothetical protein
MAGLRIDGDQFCKVIPFSMIINHTEKGCPVVCFG